MTLASQENARYTMVQRKVVGIVIEAKAVTEFTGDTPGLAKGDILAVLKREIIKIQCTAQENTRKRKYRKQEGNS